MPAPIHTTVSIRATSVWRLRLAGALPRYLLYALAGAGLLASVRVAIAPPRPLIERSAAPSAALVDRAGEGFASLFARAYLTWDSTDPEAHRLALAPFLGSSLEPEAGSQPPESGRQRVIWTQVVQANATPNARLYTVAVQTDTSGLLYLTVPVTRTPSGALALSGYPAFVGAPAFTSAVPATHLSEVEDPALTTVTTRALRNYLSRSGTELAADLTSNARVALPGSPLILDAPQSLRWSSYGRSVIAVVQAHDEHNAHYTLAYEIDVASIGGRWEVSAIQTNPNH